MDVSIKKKALIFTAATGNGHISVAQSLKAELEDQGWQVLIYDAVESSSVIVNKIVIQCYYLMLDLFPFLYESIYDHAEKHATWSIFSKKVSKLLSWKLHRVIAQESPDLIISTHPFASEIINPLKKSGKVTQPLLVVVTDYSFHRFWQHSQVDTYWVATNHVKESMILRGIHEDSIKVTGIPIRRSYWETGKRRALHVEVDDASTFLIICGGLGGSSILKTAKEIMRVAPHKQLILVTGSNARLKALLEETFGSSKNVKILGFVDNLEEYVLKADVIFTKPGGVSLTEFAASKAPIVLLPPLPGVEERNADYFECGIGVLNIGEVRYSMEGILDLINSKYDEEYYESLDRHFSRQPLVEAIAGLSSETGQ